MSNEVRLRNIEPNDLPIFYEHQLDADATRMAGFPARERAAFDAHWATYILRNPAAVNQTILVDGHVVALAENGDLVVVEARPGAYQVVARHRAVTGKCWNNAAVANGRIYLRTFDALYAIGK